MLKQKTDDDEELLANYPLSEVVLARARVLTSANTVCLWLGANVMVEYSLQEAVNMLVKAWSALRKFTCVRLLRVRACR